MSLGEQFPMFRSYVVPASSWVNPHHEDEWHYNPLKQETTHITTQHHTSVDVNPQQHHCQNLKSHNPEVISKFETLIFFRNHIFHKFHRHYSIHHPTRFAQVQNLQPV